MTQEPVLRVEVSAHVRLKIRGVVLAKRAVQVACEYESENKRKQMWGVFFCVISLSLSLSLDSIFSVQNR
jgi:hypothetical protein